VHLGRRFLANHEEYRGKEDHGIDADGAAHRVCNRYVCAVRYQVQRRHRNDQRQSEVYEDPDIRGEQETIRVAMAVLLPVFK